MTRDRKRGYKSRSPSRAAPASSSDDSGCFLVLFIFLWYFGFISVHWRDTGRDRDRLENVQAELTKAKAQLIQITKVARELENDASALDTRREALRRQVADLERVRDQIGGSLLAASNALVSPARSRWFEFLESIFTGIVGDLVSAAIIGVLGTRAWLRWRRRKDPPAIEVPK